MILAASALGAAQDRACRLNRAARAAGDFFAAGVIACPGSKIGAGARNWC
jgi:hypothetical protein